MLGHRTLDVNDYLGILKRRWWILAVPTLILPIIAFGITFFISPKYLSQTLVLIEVQKVPDSYVKPVISSDLDSRLASMREQILSRSRIQPIIERYNLYAAQHLSMDDRIDLARSSILIKPITSETHSSGLPGFFISFEAGDPHTAQMVCGEITSLFVGENLRSREASAEGTTDFLKSQLADAKRNLDEQDAKLAEFQRQNYGKLPGEESPNFNMFTSLNAQLEASTQDLARMEQAKSYEEALLSQQVPPAPPAGATPDAAAATAAATPAQQATLQVLLSEEADLTSHYTADYPDVVAIHRKIADLRARIAENPGSSKPGAPAVVRESPAVQQMRAQLKAMDQAIQSKRKEQADIQANIHMYQQRIQSSPEIAAQFKALTRDYQTAQTFYDDLLTKMNQSKMATDLEKRQEGEQFRVMDEPNLPDAPTSPKRSAFVLAGFAGGFGLGLLIVALLEYKDTALRSERDVWAFTKLPTLATINYFDEESERQGIQKGKLVRFPRKLAKPPKPKAPLAADHV